MSDLGNKEVMSRNLNRYINESGKTRTEICNDLDFKYTTFTDWVNGNKYPRIDSIEKMANYFNIKKSDLIEEHKETENEFSLKNTYFSFAKQMQEQNISEEDMKKMWKFYEMIKNM